MGKALGVKMGIDCRLKYFDRWHSEWLCARYDMPTRICCPCERQELVSKK